MLKLKRIDASDPGRILDPVEVRKEKLLARDEEKVKRQSERHVLTKTKCSHPVPRLFVSRRNDKNPNGFNCAIRSCPVGPEAFGDTSNVKDII